MRDVGTFVPHSVDGAPTEHGKAAGYALRIFMALLMGTGTGVLLSLWSFLNIFSNDSTVATGGQILEIFRSHLDSRRIGEFSYAEIQRLNAASDLFVRVAAYSVVPVTIGAENWRQRVHARFVTNSYFEVIGANFTVGRSLSCSYADSQPCLQVVVGSKLWRKRFGSDPNLIGRSLSINGKKFTITGVRSTGDYIGVAGEEPELWLPLRAEAALLGFNWTNGASNARWLLPIVRLHPGISREQAPERLASLLPAATLMSGRSSEFLLLTPTQASLARTFRIRGQLVGSLAPYMGRLFLGSILLWVIGLSWLTALFLDKQLSLAEATVLWIAAVVSTVAIYGVVRLVLISFLMRFGTPSPVAVSHLGWGTIAIATSILLAGAASINSWQRLWKKCGSWTQSVASAQKRTSGAYIRSALGLCWKQTKSHRYIVLCGTLMALELGFISNGLLGGDLYHHAAVVRELARHPLHPQHPILPVAAPHAGYSPYALMVACVSRLVGVPALDALRAAGLLNLLLLFWTLHLFVREVFPARHADFYALLFILLLWGFSPWMTSGFLHLNYLVQGAAYPSTFATALLFLAWYVAVLIARGGTAWLLLPLTGIVFVVLLDHPITAGSLIVGLFAVTFDFGRSWRSFVRLFSVCGAAFVLVGLWPYYPFYSLILGKSANIDAVISHLYPGPGAVLLMTFPALIGLPLLGLRVKTNRSDFLATIFLCSLVIYLVGAFTGKYVVGRVIYFMILALQLSAADWLSRREGKLGAGTYGHTVWLSPHTVLASAALGGLMMTPGLMTCLPIFQNSYGEYSFLSSYVGRDAIILSDFDTSLKIPAFRGKLVSYAPEHSLFFVDTQSRERDVRQFFSDSTLPSERVQILQRYRVSFVFLNRKVVENWPTILQSLSMTTSVAYLDGSILLLKINSSNGRPVDAFEPL